MKSPHAYIVAIFLIFSFAKHALSQTQVDVPTLKNKGVVYRLSVYKAANEVIAQKALKGKEANKAAVLADYIKLKTMLDAAIMQYKYELRRRHRLYREFRRINNSYVEDDTFSESNLNTNAGKAFGNELQAYFTESQKYITNYQKVFMAFDGSEISPLDVLGQAWEVYKGIREIQKEKDDQLIDLLDSVRLDDLTTAKEKK